MTVWQFQMLRHIHHNNGVTVNLAILFKQRTFGSLCNKGWIAYNLHRKVFYVTSRGANMLDQFSALNMRRPKSSRTWSMYVKGFQPVERNKIVSIRRSA